MPIWYTMGIASKLALIDMRAREKPAWAILDTRTKYDCAFLRAAIGDKNNSTAEITLA